MKLTVKKINEVYNTLSKATAAKLSDAEYKKILSILKKLYTIHEESVADVRRALDLAKPADWEEIQSLAVKAQGGLATPEEAVRSIAASNAYDRRTNAEVAAINAVEHDIDIEPISEETADKLTKESAFSFKERMMLMPVIE